MHQRSQGNEILPGTCTFYLFIYLFLPTLTCTSVQPALRYPYPPAFHLKLESSCPRIILSLVLEYPGQNYPEKDAERRNGPGSHSGVFVNVYFKMCLCLGNGLADMNVFVCANVPMSERSAQFVLLMEVFSRVFSSA